MEKRKFLRHSTFLITSKVVNSVTVFFTGIVLTRSLTKADYGTFSHIVLLSMAISLILGTWLVKSLYYFVPTSSHKKEIVIQTNLALFGLGFISGLLVWLLRYQIAHWFQNPSLASLAVYIALYALLLTLYKISEPFFISVDKAHVLALANLVFSIVYMSVLSYALIRGVSLAQLMSIIILLYLCLIVFILANILKLPGTIRGVMNLGILHRQFRYASPLFLSSLTIVLGRQVDKFIIASVYPTTNFAEYFRGAIELPVIAVVTYTVSHMLLPKFVQLFQADRKKDFMRVWHEAIKKTAIITFPVVVIFLFISQRFITFLYTERYAASVPIFRIYLLILIIQVTSYDCVLQATGRTRGIFYASGLNLLSNLLASLILIRIVGPAGAAIGLVFGQCIAMLFYLIWIRGIFRVSFAKVFPWYYLLQVLMLALCLGALVYTISFLDVLPSKLVFMGVYGLIFAMLYAAFIFKFKFLRWRDLEFMKLSLFSRSS
jgi:O-antigen/teichoic acid export membrane protein